ncbi:hypothetical protein JL721_3222 [Aureococcus anophagefferens]|nr:hypothetical protein JL721_3222 [Aureococcus anophagefferens]
MRALASQLAPRCARAYARTGARRFAALGDHFFGADGALAAEPHHVDHFALFGVAAHFDVDGAALDAGLRQLQHRLHPDRFASAPEAQKLLADAASARVNDALAVLRDPLRRADYARSLATGDLVLDDETRQAPGALLLAVMEAREAVDDAASLEDLAVVAAERRRRRRGDGRAAEALGAGDLESAAERIVELNFYGKIDAEARGR